MAKVYVRQEDKGMWVPKEEDIVTCLADPVRQGIYYLHDPAIPILEEADEKTPHRYEKMRQGCVHFASNFGLEMIQSGTSHLLSPDKKEGYILIHFTKLIVDNPKDYHGELSISLIPNMMKLMDSGHYFRYDGTFDEVMKKIKAAGYEFLGRGDDEMLTRFTFRVMERARQQREEYVSNEVAKRMSEECYRLPVTREELLKSLRHVTVF
ncbi:MAG: hypothetical protein QMD85_01720 [Candidatus Aenigmarchaeota archaeon]|nr:hypothetical protein [Candidatus Aenigmarchaeota archaeon]MDI6722271.1 hypothetical protein [Candidatus Aenigmarchaeota archaeon]